MITTPLLSRLSDMSGRYIFSVAVAANMFSMTALLIALSFFGYPETAAEVGVIQGATLAAFLAFSANARNLILSSESAILLRQLFYFRIILLLPLSLGAFFLSKGVIDTVGMIAVVLILRRCVEWVAELQISEREKSGDTAYAYRFVALQGIGFFLLMLSLGYGDGRLYQAVLLFWAITPVLQGLPFIFRMLSRQPGEKLHLKSFMPHMGSSWIIGISIYVFRVLIVLLAGKTIGGMLFSAYAIGGMLNSVYTYALGPSLAMQGVRGGASGEARVTYWVVLALTVVGGLCVFLSLIGSPDDSSATLFLMTIGFSLIGGGIMILAQRRRIRIVQIKKESVFVPDVFANILIIATVPFAFYMFGRDILAVLFLWNACLTYAIYAFPTFNGQWIENTHRGKRLSVLSKGLNRPSVQAWLLFFLILPVFFQLGGGIFASPDMLFDSRSMLTRLPLPVAVIACLTGIALLIRFKDVQLSAGVLFTLFTSMALSTFIVSAGSDSSELGKFTFLLQFILPVFALFLGQSYVRPGKPEFRFEAIFLYVLVLIVPLEVLATLVQETGLLTPYLYVFSIYQHLQYLPVIFVGLYFLAAVSLYEHRHMRALLLFLAPFIGIYASASTSILAMLMVLVGDTIVAFLLVRRGYGRFALIVAALSVAFLSGYLMANPKITYKFDLTRLDHTGQDMPVNVQDRLQYWKIYWDGITESPKTFVFGHAQRPDRQLVPSAHNYYLDLVYNFGFVALLPLIYLIIYTLNRLFQRWKTGFLPLDLLGLAALVLFFVLIDNSLKVGFRQPYPGIIMFFLWGVLLSRLLNPDEKAKETAS